jgi:diadenylate cyclase
VSQTLAWLLELVLLCALIHVFLRVVRQSRGHRVVRSLLLGLLLGAIGLFGLSDWLGLEELAHILDNVTGYVVVVLAIVFQPEMRRAMAQLGQNSFFGGGAARVTDSTLEQVAGAARAMARRRHGALIAIEGQSPLQAMVEKATAVQAPVGRSLLESIFQPGGVMHDGGVVVRDDRIVAAQVIFPLTESTGLGAWSGTRHRAALGLSEETDALVLVVSEETGRISVFQAGQRHGPIPPDELLGTLRELLGPAARSRLSAAQGEVPWWRRTGLFLRRELGWIGLSASLAGGILYVVHGQITVEELRRLHVRVVGPESTDSVGRNELLVRLGEERWVQSSPDAALPIEVEVQGTRRQLQRLGADLGGELVVEDPGQGQLELDVAAVRWRGDAPGLRFAWSGARRPELHLEPLVERSLGLEVAELPIDTSQLDPRFAWALERTRIVPEQLLVVGPASALAELDASDGAALLRPVRLPAAARGRTTLRLTLLPELVERQVELRNAEAVEVELALEPAVREAGVIEREISLACLDGGRAAEVGRWSLELHARTARLRIVTQGLVPASTAANSPAERERLSRIRAYVEGNLQVYVDLAELPADGRSRSLPVRWLLRRAWIDSLEELGLADVSLSGMERLELELESDATVYLVPVPSPLDDPTASGGGRE